MHIRVDKGSELDSRWSGSGTLAMARKSFEGDIDVQVFSSAAEKFDDLSSHLWESTCWIPASRGGVFVSLEG